MAALFAAVGCSDEESYVADQPAAQGETVQPVFRADLRSDEGVTKTTLTHEEGGFRVEWRGTDKFPADCDLIGIVVYKAGSSTLIDGASNIPYRPTQSGSRSLLEAAGTAIAGLTRGEAYDFYAYYPYKESQSNLANYRVDAPDTIIQTQQAPNDLSHLSAFDILIATPKKNVQISEEGASQIGFSFGHRISILQFSVTNGRSEPLSVQNIYVKMADGTSGLWWASDYSLKTDSSSGAVMSRESLIVATPAPFSGSEVQRFWMAIRRQPSVAGKMLAIEVTTDKGTYRLEKSAPAEGFLKGCNYTLDLTIPQTPDASKGETWTDL